MLLEIRSHLWFCQTVGDIYASKNSSILKRASLGSTDGDVGTHQDVIELYFDMLTIKKCFSEFLSSD